jgi:hypothetical protein
MAHLKLLAATHFGLHFGRDLAYVVIGTTEACYAPVNALPPQRY